MAFIRIGEKILNTDYIIRAARSQDNARTTVQVAEGYGDGDIGSPLYFDGEEGVALWAHITGQCVDVLSLYHDTMQAIHNAETRA